MSGLFFLAALIGVVWLAAWSALPAGRIGWSPFDMAGDGAEEEGGGEPDSARTRRTFPAAPPRSARHGAQQAGASVAVPRQTRPRRGGSARPWRRGIGASLAPPRRER